MRQIVKLPSDGVDTIERHKRLGCTVPEEFDQVSPQLVDRSGGVQVESGKNCGEGLLVQLVHHETDSSSSGVSDCGPAPVPGAGSAVWDDVLVLSVGPVGLVGAMIPSARFLPRKTLCGFVAYGQLRDDWRQSHLRRKVRSDC
jgi:hypothetical protein